MSLSADTLLRAIRTREIEALQRPVDPTQYTSYAYGRELAAWGMQPSFTGTGACLDNAYIESFFATLKKELVYQSTFATREEARLAIFEFIEGYYNRRGLHSSLGYQSPTVFEAQGLEKLAA